MSSLLAPRVRTSGLCMYFQLFPFPPRETDTSHPDMPPSGRANPACLPPDASR